MRSFRAPAVALVLAFVFCAFAQNAVPLPSPEGLLTVAGNAEAKADPDLATFRLGVETQAKIAKEAQGATATLASRLIDAALKVVPNRKAYQTSDLSLEPVYSQPALGGGTTQAPKIVGYRARNILSVRVEDVSKVGPLIDAVTEAGATNIDSISFGLKDARAARRQALTEAVKDARDKAEAMAAGLGLRLGDVFSVDEGGLPVVRPYEAPVMAMRAAGAPVMAGEVSLSASVTVRFRLVR